MIPAWLAASSSAPAPQKLKNRRHYLEKPLARANKMMSAIVEPSDFKFKGALACLNPATILLVILAAIITVSLLRLAWLIWIIFFLLAALAVSSSIRTRLLRNPVIFLAPLTAIILVAPWILNIFTPGEAVVELVRYSNGEKVIAVTREGIQLAALFVGRISASVMLAAILTAVLPWPEIFAAFRSLRFPQIMVLTLSMTWRYLFLLSRTFSDLHWARKSRVISPLPIGSEQKWVASAIAFVFARSLRISDEVHSAMIARGFAGEILLENGRKLAFADYVTVLIAFAVNCAILALDSYLRSTPGR